MKNKLLGILLCGILVLGLAGCGNVFDRNSVSYDELNDVNNMIIEYLLWMMLMITKIIVIIM